MKRAAASFAATRILRHFCRIGKSLVGNASLIRLCRAGWKLAPINHHFHRRDCVRNLAREPVRVIAKSRSRRAGMIVGFLEHRRFVEHRGDNPVVSWRHWINHRIIIRCSTGICGRVCFVVESHRLIIQGRLGPSPRVWDISEPSQSRPLLGRGLGRNVSYSRLGTVAAGHGCGVDNFPGLA